MRALADVVARLRDVHAFRVRMGEEAGVLVLYVLAGRQEEDWMGLVGIGVWSDE